MGFHPEHIPLTKNTISNKKWLTQWILLFCLLFCLSFKKLFTIGFTAYFYQVYWYTFLPITILLILYFINKNWIGIVSKIFVKALSIVGFVFQFILFGFMYFVILTPIAIFTAKKTKFGKWNYTPFVVENELFDKQY